MKLIEALKIEKKNPLKQGLKQQPLSPHLFNLPIEKKNPLKQGLKQYTDQVDSKFCGYWKEESIKTRIETFIGIYLSSRDKWLKRRIH